ncbi:addiction module antidote protein [Roseateles sp. GG27B]
MTQVAKDAGIGRESLYKALRPGSQPRFDTVQRVCKALGLKVTVQPATLCSTATSRKEAPANTFSWCRVVGLSW